MVHIPLLNVINMSKDTRMSAHKPQFETRLAERDEDLYAAQRLRYDVFVHELGGGGASVDHEAKLERDEFDPYYDHLLLIDNARDGAVVGVYRMMPCDRAEAGRGFYTSAEYDLAPLIESGRKILELGRSCLHKDYRGGAAMFHLWDALTKYVDEREIEILFGVASFHGTDAQALAQPLSYLYHNHLAPEAIRVRSVEEHYQKMDLLPQQEVDRKTAVMAMPALIKAYLRLGGFVGDGAFVDHPFNTTDICLLMDRTSVNARQLDLYTKVNT